MTHLNRYIRSFGIALVALVTIVMGSQSAFAQSSRTWLPAYDNSQKVYIDPGLTDFSLTPGFAGNIQQLASKHNLNVVVIATVRGADITDSDRKRWAPEYLHTTAWQHLERYPSFSEARSVVILFVKDGATVSTGVRVGSAMHADGLTRDVLNSTSGPVVPVLRANMPAEPEAAFIGIVKSINGFLDAKTAVQTPSASSTPSSESGGISGFMLIGFGLAAAVVIFVFITSISSSGGGSSSRNSSSNTRSGSSRPNTTTGDGKPDGSNRGTDIATGVVIGGVLGAEMARRGQQPAPKDKKKDSGSSDGGGTTTGGDTGGTTSGGSGCGSSGCGGGGCGGGGCGGG